MQIGACARRFAQLMAAERAINHAKLPIRHDSFLFRKDSVPRAEGQCCLGRWTLLGPLSSAPAAVLRVPLDRNDCLSLEELG